MSGLDGLGWPANDETGEVCPLQRIVRRLREWRRDAYWIAQAIRPNLEITVKTDWEPKCRMRRFLRKGNCEICGKSFREMDGGTISKREKLCEKHCMMTADEIAAHHSLNVKVHTPPLATPYAETGGVS